MAGKHSCYGYYGFLVRGIFQCRDAADVIVYRGLPKVRRLRETESLIGGQWMKAFGFTTDLEGNVRMGEGIPSKWIILDGNYYNVVVLGEEDGHRIEFGFPNSPYEDGRVIRLDERYDLLDHKPGLLFYHPKQEEVGSFLILWQADGCDRIGAAKHGARILASYSGEDFSVVLAILEEGGFLRAYPRKQDGEKCPEGAFLLLNDGELLPHREMSLFQGI